MFHRRAVRRDDGNARNARTPRKRPPSTGVQAVMSGLWTLLRRERVGHPPTQVPLVSGRSSRHQVLTQWRAKLRQWHGRCVGGTGGRERWRPPARADGEFAGFRVDEMLAGGIGDSRLLRPVPLLPAAPGPRAGRATARGLSLTDLSRVFPDEESEEAWFVGRRWPCGVRCPYCHCANG